MQKLRLEDTWNILEYEKVRGEFLQRIITLKKIRRVAVGNYLTLVFDNRDTMLSQVQEMIRIERMVDEAQIAQEIEVYNPHIPDRDELSATLFVEAQDRPTLQALLRHLVGLDQHLRLIFGDQFAIPARFEPGRWQEGRISPMQFIRFPFTADQQKAFRNGGQPASLVIDHPHYKAAATLSAETRASLARDFD
jgi:hypothetical protein